MRALRTDKMTYAALEATLREHAAGRADKTVPVARMMTMPIQEIDVRARAIVNRVSGLGAEVIDGSSTIGGGSAPGSALPTRLIALTHATLSATALEERLRQSQPPVIARIDQDRVVLDLRTVPEDQDGVLRQILERL